MRLLLVIILGLVSLHCGPPRSEAERMLADACAFLWTMQGEDGGWHSATHGLLKGGQAWTPFVLFALLEAPDETCPKPTPGIERALGFIRNHVNVAGALGLADPDVLEYPNYATAYALRVLARHSATADGPLVKKMTAYLREQQFVEHRGLEPDEVAYGSWGFGEQILPPGRRTGHVDLSHTRRVLHALHDAGFDDPALYHRAEAFLRFVQKHPADARLHAAGLDSLLYDGGFYASPVVPGVNKSAPEPEAPRGLPLYQSYATATCDGLLALLAAGVDRDDERVQAALRWLRDHPHLAYPEGIPQDHPAQWHRVLFYYHLHVRAEVYDALAWPGPWRDEMVRALAGKQHDDGSFFNPYGAANKEDDPLLATAMVVQVLTAALRGATADGAR